MSIENKGRINLPQVPELLSLVADERKAAIMDILAVRPEGARKIDLSRAIKTKEGGPVRIQTIINYVDELSQAGLVEPIGKANFQLTDFGRKFHSILSNTASELDNIARERRVSQARTVLMALPQEEIDEVVNEFTH